MKRNAQLLVGGLLLLVLVVGVSTIGLDTAQVASGWSLYDQVNTLTVDGVKATAVANGADVDPDGAFTWDNFVNFAPWPVYGAAGIFLGFSNAMPTFSGKPLVHVGFSSALTLTSDTPTPVSGYNLYRYVFGVVFKTAAVHPVGNLLSYEDQVVTASADFTVGLQRGVLATAAPDAKIMDVVVQSYTSGVTAHPDWTADQIQAEFRKSFFAGTCVPPTVTTLSQGHEGLITSYDANRTTVACVLGVQLGAGGYREVTYAVPASGLDPYWSATTIFNVYANYVLSVDVAVAQTGSGGGKAPDTNPWDMLTLILQDLSFTLTTFLDPGAILFGIVLLIVLFVLIFVAYKLLARRRHHRRK
jgi:hypothetical protein